MEKDRVGLVGLLTKLEGYRHDSACRCAHRLYKIRLNSRQTKKLFQVHLPLFLQPNPELMLEHHNEFSIGGIWSGSAIAIPEQCIKSGTRPNALRVFYTDCDQHREPAEIQYQRTGISLNGISLHGSADRMPIKLPTDHNLSIQDFRVEYFYIFYMHTLSFGNSLYMGLLIRKVIIYF